MATPDKVLEEEPLLSYTEHNPAGKATILLIHGACTTGENWSLVIPHLADTYHLLVPDLPGHGSSITTAPSFSLSSACEHLERLIRSKAHGGRAYVVGHSLGANIAIALVSSRPDCTTAVFISGFAKFPCARPAAALFPYGFWAENRVSRIVPRALVRWAMDGTDLGASEGSSCSLRLCREITAVMVDDGVWPEPWPARTLVVAAGKSGILPTSDRAQDAMRLRDIGRRGNPKTVAFVHPAMRHPWNRQAPELFASTARAWFEGEEIPSGFDTL